MCEQIIKVSLQLEGVEMDRCWPGDTRDMSIGLSSDCLILPARLALLCVLSIKLGVLLISPLNSGLTYACLHWGICSSMNYNDRPPMVMIKLCILFSLVGSYLKCGNSPYFSFVLNFSWSCFGYCLF